MVAARTWGVERSSATRLTAAREGAASIHSLRLAGIAPSKLPSTLTSSVRPPTVKLKRDASQVSIHAHAYLASALSERILSFRQFGQP